MKKQDYISLDSQLCLLTFPVSASPGQAGAEQGRQFVVQYPQSVSQLSLFSLRAASPLSSLLTIMLPPPVPVFCLWTALTA